MKQILFLICMKLSQISGLCLISSFLLFQMGCTVQPEVPPVSFISLIDRIDSAQILSNSLKTPIFIEQTLTNKPFSWNQIKNGIRIAPLFKEMGDTEFTQDLIFETDISFKGFPKKALSQREVSKVSETPVQYHEWIKVNGNWNINQDHLESKAQQDINPRPIFK